MKKILTALVLFGFVSLVGANEEGQKLVEEKCSQCHMINSMTKNKKADGKLKAPPMWGVMRKVKEHFKTEDEVTAFIRDYTFNPSEKKMIFPKATMEYFGLMPSLKKELTDEQLHIIARYLLKL
jgi:cytochrome c